MAVRKNIGDKFRKLASSSLDDPPDEGASSQPLDLVTGTIGAMDVDEPQPAENSQPHQQTNDIGSPRDNLTKHSGSAIAEAGGYRSSEQTVARRAIDEAKKEVATMQSDTLVERGAAAVDERKDLAQGLASSRKQWEPLFRRLKQFTELVDKIAEIHPYASMAWNVLSIVQKTIIGQVKLDQSIRDLLDTLESVYDFMDQAQPLDSVKSAAKLLTALAQQTTECGWFIHDYAKNKNFLPRMASNALKKLVHPAQAAPAMVKEYQAKFAELKSQLLDGSTIRTAIAIANVDLVVHRVLNTVEEIAVDVKMQRLEDACARGSRFNRDKRCIPGTRQTILQIIADWINDPLDARRVFLLYGPAGSGKSAIAHTIAAMFYDMLRLGSSYCFDRSNSELTRAIPVFATIARDLSEREPQIRIQLSRVIARDSALATSNDLREQFRRFIVEPASQLAISGPIVIVIDALDECDSYARSSLLSILQSQEAEDALPRNVRILITCRPEPDIMDVIRDAPLVHARSMNDVLGTTANEEDIQLYVRGQLSSLSKVRDVDTICADLVRAAEGLFQWAATACRFLTAKTPPLTIKQRMTLVVPSGGKRTANSQLDTLYLEVLRTTFSSTHPEVMENFHRVMSLLMTAIEPLSISALQDIVSGQADLDSDMLEGVLAGMGSLLSGTDRLDVVVRPLHTSFRDFILDPKRSHEFVVKPGKEEHLQFARGTLRLLLSEQLHINMCGLETSYRLNTYYLDLDDRVRKMITSSLVYSTRYWADHLEKTPYGSGLLKMAEQLLKDKFLFWLEVLSLLGSVSTCASALLKLKEWIPKDTAEGLETVSIIEDFLKFIRAFGVVIGSSAPHIYLSAIPFAPTRSQVRRLYESKLPRRATVVCAGSSEWPALECTMDGNDNVLCAEFSGDGKHILFVSPGLSCFDIHFWDAATGQPARRPVRCGTDDDVSSAAFSSKQHFIVVGLEDGTIQVWNAPAGQHIHTLRGHTDYVRSVAFSPDSKWIVSASGDKTVCIWDMQSEKLVHPPLQPEGHTDWDLSVTFSPDSTWVVSGSTDGMVRLWDTTTGTRVHELLRSHAPLPSFVAFSQDGKCIVSGDETAVQLWDAESGQPIRSPLRGHTSNVTALAISPDSKFVVYGSGDGVIHLWDTIEQALCTTFHGHSDRVNSVAFSGDGQYIVSGSWDRTVRVWNSSTRRAEKDIVRRHAGLGDGMAVSPDGQHIVTWHKKDICVWDVSTGMPGQGQHWPEHTADIRYVAFLPDGHRVLSWSEDGNVCVWEVSTGQQIRQFQVPTSGSSRPFSGAISPDGKYIALSSSEEIIHIWDISTGERSQEPLKGNTALVASLAFSPDGKRIASGAWDEKILLWDVETGQTVCEPLEGHTYSVACVAFSPDGASLVSGDDMGVVRIWDCATGQTICGPWRGHDNWVRSVVFSPNGQYVASGGVDSTVRFWDAVTGAAIREPFRDHTGWVTCVVFSQDGKCVMSCSNDHTIRFWDASTGQADDVEGLRDNCVVSTQPRSVSFSPDEDHALADIQLVVPGAEQMSQFEIDDSFTLKDDGWLMGPDDRRLIWIPQQNRKMLWMPQNRRTTIPWDGVTTLDLSNFAHGEKWAECYEAGTS